MAALKASVRAMLVDKRRITPAEAREAMKELMSGSTSHAQAASFLTALQVGWFRSAANPNIDLAHLLSSCSAHTRTRVPREFRATYWILVALWVERSWLTPHLRGVRSRLLVLTMLMHRILPRSPEHCV